VLDILNESSISLTEVCRTLPKGKRGRQVHLSCVLRWITQGSKAPDGRRVRLEAVRVGGRWITSKEALARFVAALTPRFQDEITAPALRSPAKRQRASERAARRLEAARI
jgi:hypothetical protein